MRSKTLVATTAVVSSLLTFAFLSPMVTFPGGKISNTASSCGGHETNQIKELERYGSLNIKYEEYVPYYERDKGQWLTSFHSSYKQEGANVSFSARGKTLCESIDTVYYTVMEHPMKPDNDK